MAAFIVVNIHNPRINTLVFRALIPITGVSSARFNFFRKFLKTFLRYRWSEIRILYILTSLQFPGAGWTWRFISPPQFPSAGRLSVILLLLLRTRCWVLVDVSRQFLAAGWNTNLIQFMILRAIRIAQILRKIFLRTQEVTWHQIQRSRFRNCRTFFRSTFLSSLGRDTLLSV